VATRFWSVIITVNWQNLPQLIVILKIQSTLDKQELIKDTSNYVYNYVAARQTAQSGKPPARQVNNAAEHTPKLPE